MAKSTTRRARLLPAQANPAAAQIGKNHGEMEGGRAILSRTLSLPAFFVVMISERATLSGRMLTHFCFAFGSSKRNVYDVNPYGRTP